MHFEKSNGGDMNKIFNCVGLALLLVACSVSAQQSSVAVIDLKQAYRSALQNNFSLKSQQAAYKGEEEGVTEAWGGVRPQLDATASYGESRFTRDFGVDQSITDTDEHTSYNVNLSQVVFSQRAFSEVSWAKASAGRSAVQLSGYELEIGFSAIESYLKNLSLAREIQVVEEEEASHARRMNQVQGLQQRGFATRADVLEARATLDQAGAALVGLRTQYQVARQNLSAVTGLPLAGTNLAPVDETLWKSTPSIVEKDWVSIALKNSRDLAVARAEIELAEASRSRARASHYPEIYLNARYSENDTFATNLREETRVEVQLKLPIYKGGSVSARSRQAAYRKEAAILDLQYRERAVRVEVTRLVEGLKGSYDQIVALGAARDSAIASLQAAERGFEAGVRGLTGVLDARGRLSSTERERLSAVYDNLKMQSELKRVAGVLEESLL